MNYNEMYSQIIALKKMPLTAKNLQILISAIGEFPDALTIYKNNFMDERQTQKMLELEANGSAIAKHIIEHSEMTIRTTNSPELTYKYYGYVRIITPYVLDQLIDEVSNRIQLENEYSRVYNVESPIKQQEDELTLNELQQFC